jgi:hypothetical protein
MASKRGLRYLPSRGKRPIWEILSQRFLTQAVPSVRDAAIAFRNFARRCNPNADAIRRSPRLPCSVDVARDGHSALKSLRLEGETGEPAVVSEMLQIVPGAREAMEMPARRGDSGPRSLASRSYIPPRRRDRRASTGVAAGLEQGSGPEHVRPDDCYGLQAAARPALAGTAGPQGWSTKREVHCLGRARADRREAGAL